MSAQRVRIPAWLWASAAALLVGQIVYGLLQGPD